MVGAKADIAIKLYGEDTHELYERAKEAATFVEKVPGAADVIVEQTMGLPQLVVKYNRGKIARYGINIQELNTIIRTAYAGEWRTYSRSRPALSGTRGYGRRSKRRRRNWLAPPRRNSSLPVR